MHWISDYQLFLFDLDGLLVNTEELHFHAYAKMCLNRGFSLPWNFSTYFKIAQADSASIQKELYLALPDLQKEEPSWDVLYAEKRSEYLSILENEPCPMLPGAERLLLELQNRDVKRAVVTHSGLALVKKIKEKNPVLNTIPYWFCREDYERPKPSPDGYLKAIATLASDKDRIIGFEDSFRGMTALMGTRAKPIFVNAIDEATYQAFEKEGVSVFHTLEDVITDLAF